MGAMATYVRAGLPEVATALAALTGEPHPLAIEDFPVLAGSLLHRPAQALSPYPCDKRPRAGRRYRGRVYRICYVVRHERLTTVAASLGCWHARSSNVSALLGLGTGVLTLAA